MLLANEPEAEVPTSTVLAAIGGVVLLLLVVLVATRGRRRRDLEPVRLGPSWTPPGSVSTPPIDPSRDERVAPLAARSGSDELTVASVLVAWDEYLSVLGLVEMPPGHRYRVYDPYDPPVAERRDGRPMPDPVRVARDVSSRLGIGEVDARGILDALLEDPDGAADAGAGERREEPGA